MKWLKHLFGRPALAQPFKQPRVQFVGEQDGPVEQDIKARWTPILLQHPEVHRAYLALGSYDACQTNQPLLCIRSSHAEDPSLVDELAAPFKELFSRDCALDIMFVSDEKESELRQVCHAFYQASLTDR
jgi:hypothetical protein